MARSPLLALAVLSLAAGCRNPSNRPAAAASWKAFIDDPEWKAARDKSEENGRLVKAIEATYLVPTPYTPQK